MFYGHDYEYLLVSKRFFHIGLMSKSSRKLANGVPAKYAIKISIKQKQQTKCIQDKESLLRISALASNARPKATASSEVEGDKAPEDTPEAAEEEAIEVRVPKTRRYLRRSFLLRSDLLPRQAHNDLGLV